MYSSYRKNSRGADLVDMRLISKYNTGVRFLLFVIDIFSKYAYRIPLKDKKCITITSAFQKLFDGSRSKRNKIWADQGSE